MNQKEKEKIANILLNMSKKQNTKLHFTPIWIIIETNMMFLSFFKLTYF